ncbi:MAG TPA: ribosome biogenesis GTP-binding protein YihA/YsxC [Chitinophagaceae bacterium]
MEIISAKYIISSPGYKQSPPPDNPEYAFIGRSNVGKSSLINMLTGQHNLAKISNTPGKTKLINHFEIISRRSPSSHGKRDGKGLKWNIVDLPGYGFATVSQTARNNWSNMIESYIRKRENLVCVFVLIDSRHEPQAIDLEFINQLGEWQTAFVLVFTKIDKNKPGATARNVEAFLTAMSANWELAPPYFLTSATKKTGRKALLDYIGSLNKTFIKL